MSSRRLPTCWDPICVAPHVRMLQGPLEGRRRESRRGGRTSANTARFREARREPEDAQRPPGCEEMGAGHRLVCSRTRPDRSKMVLPKRGQGSLLLGASGAARPSQGTPQRSNAPALLLPYSCGPASSCRRPSWRAIFSRYNALPPSPLPPRLSGLFQGAPGRKFAVPAPPKSCRHARRRRRPKCVRRPCESASM